VWIILDAGKQYSTGCAASEVELAERKLEQHIAAKYQPIRREQDIEKIDVADVLSIYVDDKGPDENHDPVARKRFEGRIGRLNDFFGGLMLSEITGAKCREYRDQKGSDGGARRDLEDLRAAIIHHQKEGLHRGVVKVALPDKGLARTNWLTRSEAAKLLWICWRTREHQVRRRRADDKGPAVATRKYPLRHLARFILIGIYTGTRAGAIASAAMERGVGRSYVDLDQGLFYRLAQGRRETKKRQPPVPLPERLLAHMRRWRDLGRKTGAQYFVEWNGAPVLSVKTGFRSACLKAGLGEDVTPHTLRHTAVTWLLQAGVSIWETAGYVGMSPEMVEKVYGHHCPDHLQVAANSSRKRPQRKGSTSETLVVSLADERRKRIAER
jgi:integrase